MISYSIDDNGIFNVKFSGPVTFLDIKNYLAKFQVIENMPQEICLFYDFQECEIDMAEEDLVNVARLADDATMNYTSVRTAFLVSKPDITAFTYIFSQFKKNERSVRRVFSTYSAAFNWLKAG